MPRLEDLLHAENEVLGQTSAGDTFGAIGPADLAADPAFTGAFVALGALLGIPMTVAGPLAGTLPTGAMVASRGLYCRLIGIAGATAVAGWRIRVAMQSGNICVAVFAGSGVGDASRPTTRKYTTGSIACPAAGISTVTLACVVEPGDFLYVSADNNTATFERMGSNADSAFRTGICHYENSAFPAPSTATPVATGYGYVPVVVAGT